jgi:hypothetical protein
MIRASLPELGQRVGDLREGQLVRQPSGGRRDRGSHAGRFAGRDRIAGDPIARMRPEVTAQAVTPGAISDCHGHQIIIKFPPLLGEVVLELLLVIPVLERLLWSKQRYG